MYCRILFVLKLLRTEVLQDSVLVKVVSLVGVRIRMPTVHLETGSETWAYLTGLEMDESPFAFGGARYPLKIEWSLDTKTVVTFVSPLVSFALFFLITLNGDIYGKF